MKRPLRCEFCVLGICLALLLLPAIVRAQTEQANPGPPPVAQALVREGDFAVKLQAALGLGTSEDEVEAETKLGAVGITPRNGWIADYPVTPDIIGELQKSVSDAAEARKIAMGKDEALDRLNNVSTGFTLAVRPHTSSESYEAPPGGAENYPNPTAISDYYNDEGPPIVTYYAPPPDFYYLYAWVPYPFWWYGFWFPGFFILHDFHHSVFVGHRVCFVSNHFNDVRVHRVFRIDPVARFNGRTFAGIGASSRRGFIATGVPHSERRIFNGPRTWATPGARTFTQPVRGGRPSPGVGPGGRSLSMPSRGGRMGPPSTGRMGVSPSGRMGAPAGGRMGAPAGGGRSTAPRSGGTMRKQ